MKEITLCLLLDSCVLGTLLSWIEDTFLRNYFNRLLFRVTRSIFKGCKRLRKHNTSVVIGTVPVRLYHAMIQGHAFFFLSNIFTSTENIKHLYKRRWSVETFFKQLKYTYSCLRCVSKSEHSFLVRAIFIPNVRPCTKQSYILFVR